jgi:hypothetical protein
LAERDSPLRLELVELIESGRHLLIGGQALMQYTPPRFTDDVDYLVGPRLFARVRKRLKAHADAVSHIDEGEEVRSESLAVDVVNARHNPVLSAVLKAESGVPSPEGLAACKYVAMTNPTRGRSARLQDAADFSKLVLRDGFDRSKLLSYMVDRYERDHGPIVKLIDDLAAGRSVEL